MHDCDNSDIRDLLPDHAHGTLADTERARVAAHLAACRSCREELALLHAVRGARADARVPDVARIVAALPRSPGRVGAASSPIVGLDARGRRGAQALPWRRVTGVAALFVGALALGTWGRLRDEGGRTPAVLVDPAGTVDSQVVLPDTRSSDAPRVAEPPAAGARGGTDALGSLGGITSGATDEELRVLIDALDSIQGLADVELVEGDSWTEGDAP